MMMSQEEKTKKVYLRHVQNISPEGILTSSSSSSSSSSDKKCVGQNFQLKCHQIHNQATQCRRSNKININCNCKIHSNKNNDGSCNRAHSRRCKRSAKTRSNIPVLLQKNQFVPTLIVIIFTFLNQQQQQLLFSSAFLVNKNTGTTTRTTSTATTLAHNRVHNRHIMNIQNTFKNQHRSHKSSMSIRNGNINYNSRTTTTTQLALRKQQPIPVVGYNGEEICDFYDRSPLIVGWRLNILSLPLLGWYLGLLSDKFLSRDTKPYIQRLRGAQLRQVLVTSGSVALIKSGQALSLRPDLLKNKIWAEELGKLVDAVGSFNDIDAMKIMKDELKDLDKVTIANVQKSSSSSTKSAFSSSSSAITRSTKLQKRKKLSKIEKMVASDPVLNLFEFYNSNLAVASASIGQVYKAKIKRGLALEAAIGKKEAAKWGGKIVAIKIQRPDVEAASSLDMYLLRRSALWLSKFRGGDLVGIADTFGQQLFGELDYYREANNCERFRELYGDWDLIKVPKACIPLTRKKILVQEWIDGEKGPWKGKQGIDMVSLGLKCSVDQLLNTGLFHADPHRGNLLRDKNGNLAFLDFGMMADVTEEERYGLIGLAIGLQNKNLPLITENLLKLGFLEDTTQLDELVPRLRQAYINATGGTGKGSDVNFSKLQAELDVISSENILRFKTPPFFTVIIRSLTILEGFALSVDPNFRLVRGAYPYVLAQLLSPDDNENTPEALRQLLVGLLTVNGEEKEIEWETLRDLLRLAQKASNNYNPADKDDNYDEENKTEVSRQTIDLFFRFLTSKTGLFLKKPLVNELSEIIDSMASVGEANLLRFSNGIIRPLPGGNGPVNSRRMDELSSFLDTLSSALLMNRDNGLGGDSPSARARMESLISLLREILSVISDEKRREEAMPLVQEVSSVVRMVAVKVLEKRGSRAMRNILRLNPIPAV